MLFLVLALILVSVVKHSEAAAEAPAERAPGDVVQHYTVLTWKDPRTKVRVSGIGILRAEVFPELVESREQLDTAAALQKTLRSFDMIVTKSELSSKPVGTVQALPAFTEKKTKKGVKHQKLLIQNVDCRNLRTVDAAECRTGDIVRARDGNFYIKRFDDHWTLMGVNWVRPFKVPSRPHGLFHNNYINPVQIILRGPTRADENTQQAHLERELHEEEDGGEQQVEENEEMAEKRLFAAADEDVQQLKEEQEENDVFEEEEEEEEEMEETLHHFETRVLGDVQVGAFVQTTNGKFTGIVTEHQAGGKSAFFVLGGSSGKNEIGGEKVLSSATTRVFAESRNQDQYSLNHKFGVRTGPFGMIAALRDPHSRQFIMDLDRSFIAEITNTVTAQLKILHVLKPASQYHKGDTFMPFDRERMWIL